uniref:Uncharacterized protein n=1 Tax=Rhizophora mucronata TaxID=61149 RepID=A0A2P2PRM1_RHIMU
MRSHPALLGCILQSLSSNSQDSVRA